MSGERRPSQRRPWLTSPRTPIRDPCAACRSHESQHSKVRRGRRAGCLESPLTPEWLVRATSECYRSTANSLNCRILRSGEDSGNHDSNSVEYRILEHTIRATDLAHSLGDVLSRVRDRRDSFVIKRNGKAVARVVPIDRVPDDATLGEALTVWCAGAAGDHAFADDLETVNASDRPPLNPWES